MTRARAIRTIVQYLDKAEGLDDDLRQAKYILEDMLSEHPGKKWDGRAIRAAVEAFMDEHGRPPTVKELDSRPDLPCHRSVELEFGVKAGKWLMQNYPGRDRMWYKFRDEEHTPEEYRRLFISEYNRIRPCSCLEYNRRREPRYPTWEYTAKTLGLRLWSELLNACRDELAVHHKGEYAFAVEAEIVSITES